MPTSTTKFLEEQVLATICRTAEAAITIYRVVKPGTDHTKCLQTFSANTDTEILGVALCTAAIGEEVQIAIEGIVPCQVSSGQSVTKGQLLSVAGVGTVQLYNGTATSQNQIIGMAMAAGGALEYVPVLLSRGAHWGANAS